LVLPKIKKSTKYKIRVVFIDQLDAEILEKDGRKRHIKIMLMPDTIRKTKIFFEYQKHFIRAFSNGHLEVEIRYDRPGFILKKLIHHEENRKNEFAPLYVEPERMYSRYLYGNYNTTDVFCFVWPKAGFRADAIGGIGLFNVVLPYIYKVPSRGFVAIPDTWIHSATTRVTFVHELFHTLEYNLGISPSHAWHNNRRYMVPEWKGEGEYDYYQWRFNETISKYGWENVNYRKRFYLHLDRVAFSNYLRFLKYPKGMRKKAYVLVKEKRYNKALKIIPNYPKALYKLAVKFFKEDNMRESEEFVEKLLKIDQNNRRALLLKLRILLRQLRLDDAENIVTSLKGWQKPRYWERIPIINEINIFIRKYSKNKGKERLLERLYGMKIMINPNCPKYYRQRANFYLNEVYDIKKALSDVMMAIKLDQGSAESLILLGEIYMAGKV